MKPHPSKRRNSAIRWFTAFLALPVPFLGVSAVALFQSGELLTIQEINRVQRSAGSRVVYGSAYSNPEVPLKIARIQMDAPQVLVLGSSRTLEMRREFIKPALSFYNGGRIADDVWHFRQALERIPARRLPRYLLIGLDQYHFNSSHSSFSPDDVTPERIAQRFVPEADGCERFSGAWPAVTEDILSGKIRLTGSNIGFRGIGMTAKMTGSGFRPDGSYRYGPLLDTPLSERSPSERIKRTLSRIDKGRGQFSHGTAVHEPSIAELRRLLQWCAAREIKVIGYLPPFAPTVVAAMRLPPGRYTYLDQLAAALPSEFEAHNYPFFDFTLFPDAPDAEFVDGFHGSERVGAKMLVEMARQSPIAAEIVDTHQIGLQLIQSADPVSLIR